MLGAFFFFVSRGLENTAGVIVLEDFRYRISEPTQFEKWWREKWTTKHREWYWNVLPQFVFRKIREQRNG